VDYNTMTVPERQQYAHEEAMYYIQYHFEDINFALRRIDTNFSYFEMDVTNAYCPQGYCRVLTTIDFVDCYCMLGAAAFRVLGLRAGKDLIVQAWRACKIFQMV
jgi:hypothetical protein